MYIKSLSPYLTVSELLLQKFWNKYKQILIWCQYQHLADCKIEIITFLRSNDLTFSQIATILNKTHSTIIYTYNKQKENFSSKDLEYIHSLDNNEKI